MVGLSDASFQVLLRGLPIHFRDGLGPSRMGARARAEGATAPRVAWLSGIACLLKTVVNPQRKMWSAEGTERTFVLETWSLVRT